MSLTRVYFNYTRIIPLLINNRYPSDITILNSNSPVEPQQESISVQSIAIPQQKVKRQDLPNLFLSLYSGSRVSYLFPSLISNKIPRFPNRFLSLLNNPRVVPSFLPKIHNNSHKNPSFPNCFPSLLNNPRVVPNFLPKIHDNSNEIPRFRVNLPFFLAQRGLAHELLALFLAPLPKYVISFLVLRTPSTPSLAPSL